MGVCERSQRQLVARSDVYIAFGDAKERWREFSEWPQRLAQGEEFDGQPAHLFVVHTIPLILRRSAPRLSIEAERPLTRWKPTAAVWKASAPCECGPGPCTGWPIADLW